MHATTTNSGLCFSGIAVNRSASPVSLISYEYRTQDQMLAAKVGSRIVHWPLDRSTGLLARAGAGGVDRSEHVLHVHVTERSAWVQGAESTSFTTSSFGDRLWSVTEVPGRRMVFWVYTSEMQ